MAAYDGFFDTLGWREWCDADAAAAPMSMAPLVAQLLAQAQDGGGVAVKGNGLPFPSLDILHEACPAIGKTRDLTAALETGFLGIRNDLKLVLDPMTQPPSWMGRCSRFWQRRGG